MSHRETSSVLGAGRLSWLGRSAPFVSRGSARVAGRVRRAAIVLAAAALSACNGTDSTGPSVPAKLSFMETPSATNAGVAMTAIRVAVEDGRGRPVAGATSEVTVALASSVTGATLSGTTTVHAVNGVATFDDLSIDKPGAGYALIASAGGLTSATSATFVIVGPSQLAFTVSPGTASVGIAMTPAVEVVIRDPLGHTVTSATGAVTLTLGGNASGATLSGTTTVTAVNGVARFSDLSIDRPGAYTITATSGDLTSATSQLFTILGPARLAFVVPPSAANAGAVIAPPVQVVIQDAQGHTVTSATNAVTVALASNVPPGSLYGTLTVHAVNGVATFADLSIDNPGNAYRLLASSSGLTSATSAGFNVNSPPSQLHVVVSSTGASFPDSFLLWIDCDSYGNYCTFNSTVPVNGAVTVPVAAGRHYVQLFVPDNCAVSGEPDRDVTANGTTEVPFTVGCTGIGTVRVTTSTAGTDPTPDGYTVCISDDNVGCIWRAQARVNDTIAIGNVRAGAYIASLFDLGRNCAVAGGTDHDVTVPADGTVSVAFMVDCSPTERIAFSSFGTLYMIHADGTSRRVVNGGLAPVWSPDGARLAYECGAHLCASNADGSGQVTLTAGTSSVDRHPTWSPDGQQIAFSSSADGTTDLYIVAATGGGATRLTQGVGFLGSPAWSPDGTMIAIDCQVDPGNGDICVIRADGGGLARLTSDPGRDYGAAWKPDGSTLAFATTRFGIDEIMLMSRDGSGARRIGLPGFAPSWSPDGMQFGLVQLYNNYEGPYEAIVVAHADGTSPRVIAQGSQPAWRPHR